MKKFTIGDTVQISGAVMAGSVGTVVYLDEKRQKYLVRVSDVLQNYFAEDDLTLFAS